MSFYNLDLQPIASVVIPAYNIERYIREALESVQNQSLKKLEVLIVDDGSTDCTVDIAQTFCEQDNRFKLICKSNGGLSSARNFGIRHARSPYIALLDGDDCYAPEKLANHVATLDAHPEIGVVYSASKIIRDDGRPTLLTLSGKPIYSDPLLALLCKNFVGHGSNAIFRKCIFEEVGEFDETLRRCEDVDYWLRVAALNTWQFYREPQALSCYRVRPSGLSFNVAQMQQSNERVIESAYRRSPDKVGPMLPTARAYLYRYLARLALTAGDAIEARRLISCGLAEDASIFWRDPRSLITLCAVYLAPLTRLLVRQSLGSLKLTKSPRREVLKEEI
jgi:glycosyltransferase involved in cell wall biosynthesis